MKLDTRLLSKLNGEYKLLSFTCDLSDVEWNGDFPFKTPFNVDVKARVYSGVLEVFLRFTAEMEKLCDICGELDYSARSLSLLHEIRLNGAGSDIEDYPFDNGSLDLQSLVFQDILLELPIRYECPKHSKGQTDQE